MHWWSPILPTLGQHGSVPSEPGIHGKALCKVLWLWAHQSALGWDYHHRDHGTDDSHNGHHDNCSDLQGLHKRVERNHRWLWRDHSNGHRGSTKNRGINFSVSFAFNYRGGEHEAWNQRTLFIYNSSLDWFMFVYSPPFVDLFRMCNRNRPLTRPKDANSMLDKVDSEMHSGREDVHGATTLLTRPPSPAPTCSQYQRKARCCYPKSIKEPICPDKDTEHAQIE